MARDHRDPRSLDITALCRDGAALEGRVTLATLSRLGDSLFGDPDAAAEAVWSVQASEKPVRGGEPERWLALRARAEVVLQCQRCLQATREVLMVDRRFRFVDSDQEAQRLDEETEDDVLVQPPRLDLLDLLEDELILALPIVPRHPDRCPQPLPLTMAQDEDLPLPNPFAKLAALRGQGSGGGSGQT